MLVHLTNVCRIHNQLLTEKVQSIRRLKSLFSVSPQRRVSLKELTGLLLSYLHGGVNQLIRYWPLGMERPVLLMGMIAEEAAAAFWTTHRKGGPTSGTWLLTVCWRVQGGSKDNLTEPQFTKGTKDLQRIGGGGSQTPALGILHPGGRDLSHLSPCKRRLPVRERLLSDVQASLHVLGPQHCSPAQWGDCEVID